MKLTKELGLILYWGEGDKTGNYLVALTNTDSRILIYFILWLRKYFEIDENRLRCRLYIWDFLNERKAKEFWSKEVNIPVSQFTKSYISKSRPNVRKVRHEHGVCRISYGSTKVFGKIMEGISKNFH